MTSESRWRRKWHQTLETTSWHLLQENHNVELPDHYFIKYLFTTKSYEVMVTNLKETFYESLSPGECRQRLEKLNPNVEAPLEKIMDHIKENLSNKNASVKIKLGDNGIQLTLDTKMAGTLPFTWRFKMKPCDDEKVSQHLTVPVMGMVGELLRQQSELVKIIHSKDKEIEDYKGQGVKVTRKHLQTTLFDETGFKNDMVTSKGFESQAKAIVEFTFTAAGQGLYEDIMCKVAYLNRDPEDDEEEEAGQDRASPAKNKAAVGNSWANRAPVSLIQPGSSHSSPSKSPTKSPPKVHGNTQDTQAPIKDSELLRRQALERKLAEEESKQDEKQKKKKRKLKL